MKKLTGPIRRICSERNNSECPSADLHDLDWDNWFQDNSSEEITYIHVRRDRPDEGETWHRVYPKRIKGRVCLRISLVDGRLYWLHDIK